ncbi:MAG TPA: hypothetical protein VFX16_34585 [Pseudonocardiaceae bacterium]|nr:hypothetical protein [Pseudonocardiaceae bacterium]
MYEDMVAVLINRLNPTSQRIDGAGGDGGRDVQVSIPSGVVIYQLKNFTGRLGAAQNRRTQVKNSLAEAAKNDPTLWHLVVPIDPTPGELKWFEGLTAGYGFECSWLGMTWLDGHMAAMPDIYRYYIEGASEETINLLREFNAEKAAFSQGLQDAVDRLRDISIRFNDASPHYAVDFSVSSDGSIAASLNQKYIGATNDAPIVLHGQMVFPDTDEGRLHAESVKASFDYGTTSSVPAGLVSGLSISGPLGISGNLDGAGFRLQAARVDGVPLELAIRVIDENGLTVGQIPLIDQDKTRGQRGAQVELADATGALKATLRVDVLDRQSNLNLKFSQPADVLPGALLPVMQIVCRLRRENSMVILDRGNPLGPPMEIGLDFIQNAEEVLDMTRKIDEIQRYAGVYFGLPTKLTGEDLDAIYEAHTLIGGATITGTWSRATLAATVGQLPSYPFSDLISGSVSLTVREEYFLQLQGREYPIGILQKNALSAHADIVGGVPDGAAPDASVELLLQPGSNNEIQLTLISPDVFAKSFGAPPDGQSVSD